MSSVTRFIKQIPTDSAYFTVWGATTTYNYTPSTSAPTTVVDADFTDNGVAVAVGDVLRDMGQFYVTSDSGRMFRRVQKLDLTYGITEGVVGSLASSGIDNAYQVCYIEMPQKASLGNSLFTYTAPATRVARFG